MGLTVLDAGVIIGYLDANDAHHPAAIEALRDARDRNDRLILPASAFAEILVGPFRNGPEVVEALQALVHRVPLEIQPLDAEIAMTAAALRARQSTLRLPDAVVIATADHLHAGHLVTTDRKWPSRSKLKIAATLTVL